MAEFEFECRVCSRTFPASRPALTCSDRCRAAAHRADRRQRAALAVATLRAGLNGDPAALAIGAVRARELLTA